MAGTLGHPSTDPHGDPIPEADGSIHEPACIPLSEVELGETTEIRRVDESHPERLRYLASLGLRPGVVVTLLDRQPFGGPVTLAAAGQSHILGQELAHVILCARTDA
jgi:DtxR family Mn-dependent transcriptional regulator